MSDADGDFPETEDEAAPPPRFSRRRKVFVALAGVSLLGLGGLWLARENIANKVISGKLDDLGLPANYKIESIGPRHQVLSGVVIGDPAHPDLTVERVDVEIVPTLGLPTVGRVTLLRPRLYGTVRDAKASFGALDKLIFAKTEQPAGLPDLDLVLIDGRARILTDYGAIGAKAEGAGNLRGGFAGALAAVAPQLALPGCKADKASIYGKVSVTAAKPRFEGPLRLDSLACKGAGLTVGKTGLQLTAETNEHFDALGGKFGLTGGVLAWQGNRATGLKGSGDFNLARGDLTARYALEGQGLATGWADAANLAAEGMVRSHDGFARIESDGELKGAGLRPGLRLNAALADAARSGEGSLLGPVASQIGQALRREGAGSKLSALYNLRMAGGKTSLIAPRLVLRGASGADLLTMTRLALTQEGKGVPRISGNLRTGGAGLPHIEGQIERLGGGQARARLAMAEYRAGDTRIALPQLQLAQGRGGELGFSGQALLSGALPGGRADGLMLPLDGNWSPRRGLAMWRRCTAVRFQRLAIGNLALEQRGLTLCPGRDGAILRSDGRGTRLAAGTPSLDLAGKLGTTPIRMKSGAVGFAWPGALAARNIDVAMGDPKTPSSLKVADLKAQLGRKTTGTFAGTELKLAAVPLDVLDASGRWSYVGGDLAIDGGALRLEDRELDDRFKPLIARDAVLTLHSTEFRAQAKLREPVSDREIVEVRILHDLDTARGHADLDVAGINFDRGLQPDTLSRLALGVIALAKGRVSGKGAIDWNGDKVTSSGAFSTPGLDFAAAFGPVKGASGTVQFTDLLGLVTAPDQRIKLASINPGIEVYNGEVSFELQGDNVLMVNGAHWPFIDGTMDLLPTRMVLGAAEVRRYTLKMDGINAAKFVQQLELSNISATGIFDGTMPLIFDENGGRIEGGMLVSRPPGGNVSYVGELTYKDMGAMANFAFQALRSLDYRKMQLAMDGPLEGEIVTRVRFDGVRQGADAKQNIITRRLASLPIQFNLNIRAPFQRLIHSFKAMYDPDYIPDPRKLGLLDKDGKPIVEKPPAAGQSEKVQPIQPSDSRNKP